MKTVEPWKRWTFIGALAVIAFFIHARTTIKRAAVLEQQRQAQAVVQEKEQRDQDVARQKQQEIEAEQKAKADEQARYEKFLRQYVNAGFSRKPGIRAVAIVATTQNGSLDYALTEMLSRRFKEGGTQIYSSFFTQRFVADGLFSSLLNGSTEIVNELKLSDFLDGVLLASQQVRFTTNSALENLITANVRLDVVSLPIPVTSQSRTWSFTANGAGFHNAQAIQLAQERLEKQIVNDNRLSLR